MRNKRRMKKSTEQICQYVKAGKLREQSLPPECNNVVYGIQWGSFDRTFTPAYWKMQVIMASDDYQVRQILRGSGSLSDEICSCLLGGYGISAEMGYAAYAKLRCKGLTRPRTELNLKEMFEDIYCILISDLNVAGHCTHYRFPRQKALRIVYALIKLSTEEPPKDELLFRRWLLTFNGIGPKTASWITRNWLGSNKVAIIDIHIFRACTLMSLFRGNENVEREYFALEERFLKLAQAMNVSPAEMDLIMWMRMREMGRFGRDAFKNRCRLLHRNITNISKTTKTRR